MPAWFPKPEKKRCSRCGEEKLRTDFPVEKRRRDSVGPWCYECINAQRREAYWSNVTAARAAAATRWRMIRKRRKAAQGVI